MDQPTATATTTGPPWTLDDLRAAVVADLPLPGRGRTAERWEHLVALGRCDLSLAKLVEPHHDATAILADLGGEAPGPGQMWAVWAAEPPGPGLHAVRDDRGWRLEGTKPFCSGAAFVTDALLTATVIPPGPGTPTSALFAVDLQVERDQVSSVVVDPPRWVATGMAGADTRTLTCDGTPARAVGAPGEYAERAGFWHGAIGVAACWAGGVHGVAARLLAGALRRAGDNPAAIDPLTAAHLGAVAVEVDRCDAALAQAAREADAGQHARPAAARRRAESVRACVVHAAEQVVSRVGRALGPGPLAFDADHIRRVSDLQLFCRQHHAEADLAALGALVATRALAGEERW